MPYKVKPKLSRWNFKSPKDIVDVVMSLDGVRKQVDRGQVAEIVSKLSDLMATCPAVIACMVNNGIRRKDKGLATPIEVPVDKPPSYPPESKDGDQGKDKDDAEDPTPTIPDDV